MSRKVLKVSGADVSWLNALADSADGTPTEVMISEADLESHEAMDNVLQFLSAPANNVEAFHLRQSKMSTSTACLLAKAIGRSVSLGQVYLVNNPGWDQEASEVFLSAMKTNVLITVAEVVPFFPAGLEELLRQNLQVRSCRELNDTRLRLERRELTWGVPAVVFQLSNLTRLDLSQCKLTSLAGDIRRLSGLTELCLRENQLAELPAELIYVRRLKILELQENLLRAVPLFISWLNDVEFVNLRGNMINKEPPEAIGALEKLRDLDLTNQKVEVSMLPKKMPLRGEPLVTWCRDRLKGVQPARMRIVVLGEPKSGKSSVVEALRTIAGKGEVKEEAALFSAETEGVAMSNAALPGKNLELKFWDFRSSLSWAANQAFFTNGVIYLICFDLRASLDQANIDFWLSLVVSRAPRARIYLCGTHLDDPICSRARIEAFANTLQGTCMDRIANVRELIMVSSVTNKNIKDLLNAIVRGSFAVREAQVESAGLGGTDLGAGVKSKLLRNISSRFRRSTIANKSSNQVGRNSADIESKSSDPSPVGSIRAATEDADKGVPPAFIVFEQKLFALRLAVNPPLIKWSQFEGLANHSGITKREDLILLAGYLQDLGSILFFESESKDEKEKEKRSFEMDDMVILDMRWLMKVFTSVTGWNSSFVGQIETSALMKEWDLQPLLFPQSLRPALLWLLEKFEVMFLTNGASIMFAPCLLDNMRSPTFEQWWPQKTPPHMALISRVYTFDFLPLGFGGRFLGSVLRMGWKAMSGWKNGMAFLKDSETLLIEINSGQHSLRIHIRYPMAGNCSSTLGPLVESLSTLIRDSLQSSVTVEVPCPHCLAAGTYDYYSFNLDELSALMADGSYFAYCRSIYPVRIYNMAPDVSVEGLQSHVIPFSSIKLQDKLGDGSYSVVYKGEWNGQVVAVKMMNLADNFDTNEKRKVFSEWRREVETMRSLHHGNIVAMRGICLDPICMLLDMCNAGDLYHFLAEPSNDMFWKLRLSMAADVASGMSFLHSVTPPIVHRDLKSPNVLLHRLDSGEIVAKVADFGLSVRFGLVTALKGAAVENPVWTAPEVLMGLAYDASCDVYSFGVILWELLTRKQFFGEVRWNSEIERLVQDGKRPPIPSDCPRLYEGLIQHCWSSESGQRPAFSQIMAVLSKISESLGLDEDPSSSKARLQDEKKRLALSMSSEESSGTGAPIVPLRNLKTVKPSEESEDTMSSDNSLQMKKLLGGNADPAPMYQYSSTIQQEGQIQCMVHFRNNEVESIWTGDNDGFVHVFNLTSQKLLHRFRAHSSGVLCMVLTNKKHVWTSSRDGSIRMWSWTLCSSEPICVKTVRKPSKRGKAVTCMICEHDVVLCGNSSGQIVGFREPRQKKSVLAQTDSSISCILVSNGLIWVGVGDAVFCTSGEDPPKSFLLRGHKGPVHQLIKVGQNVWSVSSDKTCVVWNVKNGAPRCVEVLEGHASRIFAGATDGSKFVWTGGWDKTIIAWNFSTHKFICSMEAKHDDAIAVLLWINNVGMTREKLLVSGSWDGRIVLWKDLGVPVPSEVKLAKSVSDHWGAASASPGSTRSMSSADAKASLVDSFGRGLKLLGRSPSKGTLPSVSQESPRAGVMSRLSRKPSRSMLPEVTGGTSPSNKESNAGSRHGSVSTPRGEAVVVAAVASGQLSKKSSKEVSDQQDVVRK